MRFRSVLFPEPEVWIFYLVLPGWLKKWSCQTGIRVGLFLESSPIRKARRLR